MATSYTSLLGLALPVTGELQGTWGTTVNDEITSLLDSAVAGTTTLSADSDVVLTTTTGAANQARQSIILWTANGTVTRNITAPAQSKAYVVINASAGTQSIVIRGAGPTTGVTVAKGERVLVAWNGSDFVRIAAYGGTGEFTTVDTTNLEVTNIKAKDGTSSASIADSTGVMSLVANPVLSGGTANGVLYLNGSKVATSVLGFTFNGSTLSVGGNVKIGAGAASNSQTLMVNNPSGTATQIQLFQDGIESWTMGMPASSAGLAWAASGTEQMRLTSTGLGIGTSSPGAKLDVQTSGSTSALFTNGTTNQWAVKIIQSGSTELQLSPAITGNSGPSIRSVTSGGAAYAPLTLDGSTITLKYSGTTGVLLDASGNLGIGTSSPAFKLDVDGSQRIRKTGAGYNAEMLSFSTITETGAVYRMGMATGAAFIIGRSDIPRTDLTLDSSGNLGLGVTPSAWGTSAFQTKVASVWGFSNNAYVGCNYYFDGTNRRYIATAAASEYAQFNGQHTWYTAPSGTAGNAISFTQAMTLSGTSTPALRVGVTADLAGFNFQAANQVGFSVHNSSSSATAAYFSAANNVSLSSAGNFAVINGTDGILFGAAATERARITSGGDFLVGTTSTTSGARLDVKGVDSTGSNYCMFFENSSSALLLAVQNDGRWRSGTAAASPYNYTVGATNRDLFVDNLGEIGYVSSVRASKTNISSVSNVDWLLRLNPVTFNFRKKNADGNYTEEADGPLKHGLIAEEVEAVNSDLCFYDDAERGGALRGVNYTHLITPMLKLIQEQQALITALTARVAVLEGV